MAEATKELRRYEENAPVFALERHKGWKKASPHSRRVRGGADALFEAGGGQDVCPVQGEARPMPGPHPRSTLYRLCASSHFLAPIRD